MFNGYNEFQLENIEAELVYLIRANTNNWPIYQNEVHFNNKFEKGNKIAEKNFNLIKGKSNGKIKIYWRSRRTFRCL